MDGQYRMYTFTQMSWNFFEFQNFIYFAFPLKNRLHKLTILQKIDRYIYSNEFSSLNKQKKLKFSGFDIVLVPMI